MKIILVSVGTRGDMEPFLAIGELLKDKGHQVICAFPEQFRRLAVDSQLEFASLGSKYIELLESDAGKAAMGGSSSGLEKFLATVKLARNQTPANQELVAKQHELVENQNPDRILYNGKAVYPVIWGIGNPGKNILISPVPYMHYVKDQAHIAFNRNFGPFINRLTYSLADFGLVTTIGISVKWLGLEKMISRDQIRNAILSNKVIYTISPSLFPRPEYWEENLQVLGFQGRNQKDSWQPDEELAAFLNRHSQNRIIFITFGSMTNPDPVGKTQILVDILEQHAIPAVINTAGGGLLKPDHYNSDLIHFLSRIPYDWILPKMHSVIHHGGSGTTHLGLKYGCSTMIIPHIIDQFVWDKIVSDIGAGPRGVRIDHINRKNLEPKILDLMYDDSFKTKAEQIGHQIKTEDLSKELYELIAG
jgi:UDP:flavonoid glycosyltransferase YjiC (YdhE family)